MKIYNQILAAILMTGLTGCEKELDFKYHDIDPIVVIEGELTPEGAKVGITMTTPMDEPMDRTHLTDATVRIEDITEGITYDLSVDEEGFFRNPTPGIA